MIPLFRNAMPLALLCLSIASHSLLGALTQQSKQTTDKTQQKAEVDGAIAQIWMPESWRFGQPIECSIVPIGVDNTTFEVTDKLGKSVSIPIATFRMSLGGAHIDLKSPEEFAQGRYWKPGVYYLQATCESENDPFEPDRGHGKLITNRIRFEVLKPGERRRTRLDDPLYRRLFEGWLNELNSDKEAVRLEAEKNLGYSGLESWPFIIAHLPKASPRVATHLKNAQQTIVQLIKDDFGSRTNLFFFSGLDLGDLDYSNWGDLQKHFNGIDLTKLRVRRARVIAPLSSDEEKLVGLLSHNDPDIRILAIRSLSRSKNKDTLAKLMGSLQDDYSEYWSSSPLSHYPNQSFPVVEEAIQALLWQGKTLVPMVIEMIGKQPPAIDDNAPMLDKLMYVLKELGPTEMSEQYLKMLVKGENKFYRRAAIDVFKDWGRVGIPVLLNVVQQENESAISRSSILAHVCRFATAEEVGPILPKILESQEASDELKWEALKSIQRYKLRDIVPDLKRIALSEKSDDHLRIKAIDAVVGLATKSEAENILLALMEPKTDRQVRLHAIFRAGRSGFTGAVPKLLDMFQENDVTISQAADRALRMLARLPDGVGFDPVNPDSELWRKWWDAKK